MMDADRFAVFQRYQLGLLAQGCYPTNEQLLGFLDSDEFLGEEVTSAIADTLRAVLDGAV